MRPSAGIMPNAQQFDHGPDRAGFGLADDTQAGARQRGGLKR
jgi:hypothetical protein